MIQKHDSRQMFQNSEQKHILVKFHNQTLLLSMNAMQYDKNVILQVE